MLFLLINTIIFETPVLQQWWRRTAIVQVVTNLVREETSAIERVDVESVFERVVPNTQLQSWGALERVRGDGFNNGALEGTN